MPPKSWTKTFGGIYKDFKIKNLFAFVAPCAAWSPFQAKVPSVSRSASHGSQTPPTQSPCAATPVAAPDSSPQIINFGV